MDVGADLILGWDWISSHDLKHLYADGQARLQPGPALLQLDLFPAGAHPTARALSVISHGAFRRLLRQIARERPVVVDTPPVHVAEPAAAGTCDAPPLDGSRVAPAPR